ncbi:hypothetical protein [Paenibacillus sp. CMAA1364]
MIHAVLSDTDIIVHMVKGDVFTQVVPLLLDKVYITPKVEEELKNKHRGIHSQLTESFSQGTWLFKVKDTWGRLTSEQRILINKTREKYRAQLDPGELDCLAYATGMNIGAIISDDRGAKEIIVEVTHNEKIVITFWDLLIMGAKKDKISWSDAGEYYNKVKQSCLPRLPDFSYQVSLFERNLLSHPWVIRYLE